MIVYQSNKGGYLKDVFTKDIEDVVFTAFRIRTGRAVARSEVRSRKESLLIARYLPTKGSAVPLDPLSMGFNPGLNDAAGKRFTHRMQLEARDFARSIEKLLPADFNLQVYDQLLKAV